jgi:hypothetical protein
VFTLYFSAYHMAIFRNVKCVCMADLMYKMKFLNCRNRFKGVITITEDNSLKIHKSESIFKKLGIVSDNSVISFYNYIVSNFFILYSWRWLSVWPKHVAVQSVYKLILIQLCAFLGTIIASIYIYIYMCVYIHVYIQSGVLQWTVLINTIRKLQRTRRNTIGRRNTRVRMTCRAFPLRLERQSSSLLSFVRFSYQFSSVICAFSSENIFV